MNTYLLTWNPGKRGADSDEWLEGVVEYLGHSRSKRDQWSTGRSKSIAAGSRVFLLRQGHDRPGIIGTGKVTKGWFEGEHWNPQKGEVGRKANYIKVAWDSMVLPEHVIPREELLKGILAPGLVNAQSSGRPIPGGVAQKLEWIWSRHLKAIYSGVTRKTGSKKQGTAADDSYDDLPVDTSSFGSDGAPSIRTCVSGVRRDPRVRLAVIKRSKGTCERATCGEGRNYGGFLDVHHILGAGKSDRVWNCVALCPNCHRECHYAPERDVLNKGLLKYASCFR